MGVSTDGQICLGVIVDSGVIDTLKLEESIDNDPTIELVNYCSDGDPLYILAIKKTIIIASRGFPVIFPPKELGVTVSEVVSFVEYCKKNGLDTEPKWYLSSYFG